jgi:predicted metal-dependent peptidase
MSSKFAPLNWFSKKETKPQVNNKEISGSKPVEHSDQYKIVVVLDESGSMDDIRQDMIDALNSLITEQKQISERPAKFTLVKFNDSVTRVVSNRDLREVSTLTRQDYRPDRSTGLYDALGETIDWFRYETDVLMVIITDGMENSIYK